MGTLDTVLNNFTNSLAMAVKADEWCNTNDITKLNEKEYQGRTLPIDTFSLANGILFTPVDAQDEVYVKGPRFMLYKD